MPARGVHTRVAATVATMLVATLLALTGPATPAGAAVPEPPSALQPSGGLQVDGVPVLGWERVAGATSYDVQVAANASFSPVAWSASSTVNRQAVPTAQLPAGELWWRVRARSSAGAGEWTTASFTRSAVAGPVVTGPADGVELAQPTQPPVLAWQPVTGVTTYTVEISPDENFADPARITTKTTKGTTFVLDKLQAAGTYYWRVRGQLAPGFTTAWSQQRSYRVLGLARPELVGPVNDVNANVQDVVLDWRPVPGAASYDVQVSTDVNFSRLAASANGVLGTRWSPPTTIDNDQYYWRVRPTDAARNSLDWSAVSVWRFRRAWPLQPQLEYPAQGAVVGDPFYFQWTPVELASAYYVQISTTAAFGPPAKEGCRTTHTTFTPVRSIDRECMPTAAGTYYWRVVAVDEPANVLHDALSGPVHRFTYDPDLMPLSAPARGATVTVPTLSWRPVARAAQYRVTLTAVETGSRTTATTSATTWTPRGVLEPGQYRWQVQTVSADGRLGAELLPSSQRTFTVAEQPAATADAPTPTAPRGTSHDRFPALSWTPVAGADRYAVWIRPSGATAWRELADDFGYPAGDDRGTDYLNPGEYEWYVEAYASSKLLREGPRSTFRINALPAVRGHRAAITGNALTGAYGTPIDACAATLPAECQNLRQSPVLSWEADERVGSYRLYLSYDSELTNLVPGYAGLQINDTMWAFPETLPESQAGSAYYWKVVPCITATLCRALGHAEHAFNKLGNQVELISPAAGATVSDDVALTWRDLLSTEQRADTSDTVLTTPARTVARRYLVEVATDANFQNVIDSAEVDQTTYTAPNTTYPEGPLFWRVRAEDGSRNLLPWSEPRQLTKVSPVPQLGTPAEGAAVPGDTALSWTPLDFAASYDVEVYKLDDRIGNERNRVLSVNSQQVVLALATPLAASATTYTWRVRRVDASNRKGAWSALRPFVVTGPQPTLASPAVDADVPPSDALFTWDAEAAAASYRWERRRPGSSDIAESVTTAATAYAPTKALADGAWEWRVSALDSNGALLGSSPWRTFTVQAAPKATVDVGIEGSGAVGTPLTAVPPEWDMPDVANTYQWLRNGSPIRGATSAVYELTPTDLGKAISVRATGNRVGYLAGTSTSEPVTVIPGVPLVATAPPVISGDRRVGGTLRVTPGTWPGSPRYTYQWLRNGRPTTSTGPSYRLSAADAGGRISARVTASSSGFAPGTADSATVSVPRLAATVTATTAPRIKAKQRAKVAVRVTAPGTTPTGTITITEGKRTLARATLTAARKGNITVRLPKLKRGKHVLVVTYAGNPQIAPAKARKVRLRVG